MQSYSVKMVRTYEITIQVKAENEQDAISAAQHILEDDEDVEMILTDEYVEKVAKD
jgi:DNA/RNA endonuclease YhcR with UshA esterase domain